MIVLRAEENTDRLSLANLESLHFNVPHDVDRVAVSLDGPGATWTASAEVKLEHGQGWNFDATALATYTGYTVTDESAPVTVTPGGRLRLRVSTVAGGGSTVRCRIVGFSRPSQMKE